MRKGFLLLTALSSAFSQVPVITGVQNAASNTSVVGTSAIAPQSLVAITGQNLSTLQATTADYPWLTKLAGSAVIFNGTPAVLSYVSPSQINAVVPTGLKGSAVAAIVVTTTAGASAPVTVTIATSALGIFTQDMTGCGQASAFNVHADGTMSLNTPQNSLDPARDIGLTLFLTGLGAFPDRTDGVPWQFNPSDNRALDVGAGFGISGLRMYSPQLKVTYSGPAPTLSGVDQVNLGFFYNAGQALAPEGCRVPLSVGSQINASQIVSVSIHSGGGTCSDSPADTLGIVTWQQNVVSDVAASSSSTGIAIQFLQASTLERLSFPDGRLGGFGELAVPPQPAFCAAAYPATLDAGMITVSGNGIESLSLQPQTQDGIVSYQAALPSIPGGDYTVTASGSAVGPLRSTARIPQPITITTNLQPGTRAVSTLNWTGGDTSSQVTVKLISDNGYPGEADSGMLFGVVPASAGTITLQLPFTLPGGFIVKPSARDRCCVGLVERPKPEDSSGNPGNLEIVVIQEAAAVPAQPFNAPGLTLGGEQTWRYVWDFRGLSSQ